MNHTQKRRFNDCPTDRALAACLIVGGLIMWAIANAIIEIASFFGTVL